MTALVSYIKLLETAIDNLQLACKLLPKECEKQEEVLLNAEGDLWELMSHKFGAGVGL